jgi:hypothetical protein
MRTLNPPSAILAVWLAVTGVDFPRHASAAESAGRTRAPSASSAVPWQGRLSIATSDRGFIDAAGAWQLPLCAHFGEGFSAYVHGKTVDGVSVEEQLRTIKSAGYDCIRSWIHLGFYQSGWKRREVTPFSFAADDGTRISPTTQYYERLMAFVGLLDSIGLRLHLTQGDLNGVPRNAVRQHYRRVAELLDERGLRHVIALVEAINEDHVNGAFGPATLLEWVEPFKSRGYIVASSCPTACSEEADAVTAYSRGFSVRYYHGHRTGDATDRLRHIFTTTYETPPGTPRLAWEGEPIGPNNFSGPGVSGNHTEDAEELGLLPVQRLIARGAWTYMSQCGVFWHCRIETHTAFHVVPKMRNVLRDFAPEVMTWPTLVHGGRPEAVLVSPIGYHDPGRRSEGPARIDQVVSPDARKAVAVVYGGSGRKPVQNRMGCTIRLKVVRPMADQSIDMQTFTLAAGETIDMEFRIGRLLLAECQ